MHRLFIISLLLTFLYMSSSYGGSSPSSGIHSVPALITKAENGDVWAQETLGAIYHGGGGVEKNPAEAIKWLKRAAERSANARHYLGSMYFEGNGVAQDYAEAYFWLLFGQFHTSDNLSGPPDFEVLQKNLTPEQTKTIRKRLAASIDQANPGFLRRLAIFCKIAEDYEEAYFWLSASEKLRPQFNRDWSADVEKHLTDEQLQAVKERVDKWYAFLDPKVQGFIPR